MPKITVEIPQEVLNELTRKFQEMPLDEAVKKVFEEYLRRAGESKTQVRSLSDVETLMTSIQRMLRSANDTLNAYSALMTEIRNKLTELYEAIDNLSKKIDDIGSKVALQQQLPQPQVEVQQPKEKVREKISAIEILKKQNVIYESEIASKIRNRDAFFDKLKREGAVVLELKDQRIAVDKAFWEEFLEKVSTLKTNVESEYVKVLGRAGAELLKKLNESGIAIYDVIKKKWVVHH
ncbi:MAG: hypothetical protein B7O98_03770 [Zestosphaera tikiterensis]|uniref:CopG family transcriptional regulator n=1 Tax=Zestosphaera tikiterensis TaxID=1973259 RepID=A0A2R7Y7N5_9CREN|nr:MAG: hypothetical protein B7O98_03770 [Zestosphaera tikiterensis]